MTSNPENGTGHKASEMWVGMRSICGETSVVVGIVAAGRTHVFLATREVVEQLGDHIATMLGERISRSHAPQPRLLSRNGADRRFVAGVTR